ncbi:hypothetical protein ABPG72_018576 [Tetrahymena utriculariae]
MDLVQKYVIPNTITPFMLSAMQFIFDKFFYDYTNKQAFYDSMLSLGSLVGSKVLTNTLVAKTVGVLDNYYANNFISYLSEPLLNYLIYGYLYQEKFKKTQDGYKSKSETSLMIMPLIQSIIGMFLDGTVVQWITGYNKSNIYSL